MAIVEWVSSCPCKWCGCDKNTPNPLLFEQSKYPTLRWRRPDGKECALCPFALESDERTCTKEAKAKLLIDLNSDDGETKQVASELVTTVRDSYIGTKNKQGGGHIMKSLPSAMGVEGGQMNGNDQREFMGYFWRMQKFKLDPEYKKPTPKEVTKLCHFGQILVGVIREVGQGVIGVIELWRSDAKFVKLGAVMGSSAELDHQGLKTVMNKGLRMLDSGKVKESKKKPGLFMLNDKNPDIEKADEEDDDFILAQTLGLGDAPIIVKRNKCDDSDGDDDMRTPSAKKRKVAGEQPSSSKNKRASEVLDDPVQKKGQAKAKAKVQKASQKDVDDGPDAGIAAISAKAKKEPKKKGPKLEVAIDAANETKDLMEQILQKITSSSWKDVTLKLAADCIAKVNKTMGTSPPS